MVSVNACVCVCVCVCLCIDTVFPFLFLYVLAHPSHTLIVRCGRQSSVSMLKQLLPRPSRFPSCVRFFAPV